MEKIKNMLGLRIHNDCIMDKFDMILVKITGRIAGMIVGDEDVCPEKEVGPLESRAEILGNEEEKAYKEALRLLAKLRPEYKKYLPKRGKGNKIPDLPDLLKKKIRLAVWAGVGYKIPDRNLREVLLKNLLKEKGYTYRRNELRWYRGDLCVGKDLFGALEHLESLEAVDRRLLTISF